MDNSNDKLGKTNQTKQDDLRKAGQKQPIEEGKKGLGSQAEPHKFGQNPQDRK
jgi:hypothetical protein